MHKMKSTQGFTLIEILIVVAVIAILAAIALPAYNNYVNRAKIKTAQADLTALSLNYENHYQRTLAYPDENPDLSTTALLKGKFTGWQPASEDFSFSNTNESTTGYTVTATGTAGGISGCTVSLTHTGVKSVTSCSYGNGGWL